MILAGDIGGTNARLALFDVRNGQFNLVTATVFPSQRYSGLDQIVTEFVNSSGVRPSRACFGVAGPVTNGKVETSNLPWIIESRRLADELQIKEALLINDLEANAYGIAVAGDMLVTTLLVTMVARGLWGWPWLLVAPLMGSFLALDNQEEYTRELLQRLAPLIGQELTAALYAADQSTEEGIRAQRERVATLKAKVKSVGSPEARDLSAAVMEILVRETMA